MKTLVIAAAVIVAGVCAAGFPPEAVSAPKEIHEKERPRAIRHPRVGHKVHALPRTHRSLDLGSHTYYYHRGDFYRPYRPGGYVVVHAPLGARVHSLPPGYISFLIGPHRYFYVNLTYYLWDRETREYIVVDEPEGAEAAVVSASETASGDIYVYPKQGQSDEQRDRDRYECYQWAVEQTDFDPAAGNQNMANEGNYRRAISACLEGRGYTVK